MVLQRGKPAAVWGTADPGERVTVEFGGETETVKTPPGGRWLLRLDPLTASAEPRELVVRSGSGSVTVRDVLVGDVWIAGGQSNMGRQVRASWRPEAFSLDWPQVRFLAVQSPGHSYPRTNLTPALQPPRGPALAAGNRDAGASRGRRPSVMFVASQHFA